MNFDELMELTKPYRMSENIDELAEAKGMIDDYRNAHLEELTSEQRDILSKANVRLMRKVDDLLPYQGPYRDDEDDGIFKIRIPAG